MPSVNEINYYLMLNTDFEKKLCQEFLFKYESLFDELGQQLNANPVGESIQVKLNITKLFKYLVDLTNLVSKYYSKIHILEDPKIQHLHEKMTARIFLIKSIYSLIQRLLGLFGINALKCI